MFNYSNLTHVSNFFSEQEVNDFLVNVNAYGEKDFFEAEMNYGAKGQIDREVRSGKVLVVRPSLDNHFLNKLLHLIVKTNQDKYKLDIKNYLTEWQVLKYNQGDHFSIHQDALGWRKLSAVVFLSSEEEFEGGEFVFYEDPDNSLQRMRVKQTKGSVMLFPVDAWHAVHPTKKGTRFSLVSWVG